MGLSLYTPTSVIAHTTSVDFSKRNISQPVHIVQYDKRLPILAVNIYNNGQLYPIPSDATVSIRFGKPDKTFVYNEAIGCDSTRTIVYFEITEQMTIFDGEFYPVIEILRDNKTANSSKIYIIVDRNPIQIGDIESTVEFKNLTEYRDEAKKAAEEAKKAATGVGEIKDKAETAANNASKSETNAKVSADNSAKSASDAKNFADSASSSATKAAQSEANAKESEANASTKAAEASSSATKAAQSEANAKESEANASTKAAEASSSATKAAQSEANAKESEANASTKATEASSSATKAAQSEANAKESANKASMSEQSVINHENTVSQLANNAEVFAKKSESWAVGGTSTRDGEDTNNSKWYAEEAKKAAKKAESIAGGNFIPASDKGVAGGVAVLDNNLAVAKAVGDEEGNNIKSTYAKKTEIAEAIEVDSELSTTSTNTVQNKVITKALQEKAGTNDIDALNKNITQLQDSKADKTEIPTELPANGGNADTVNNHTVKSDVPENAVFTDTTYSDATTSAHGLMSAGDKSKLDGIATGANKTTILNSLAATTTGYALDAIQGKALNDKITAINDSLANMAWQNVGSNLFIEIDTTYVSYNTLQAYIITGCRLVDFAIVFTAKQALTKGTDYYFCKLTYTPDDAPYNYLVYYDNNAAVLTVKTNGNVFLRPLTADIPVNYTLNARGIFKN